MVNKAKVRAASGEIFSIGEPQQIVWMTVAQADAEIYDRFAEAVVIAGCVTELSTPVGQPQLPLVADVPVLASGVAPT